MVSSTVESIANLIEMPPGRRDGDELVVEKQIEDTNWNSSYRENPSMVLHSYTDDGYQEIERVVTYEQPLDQSQEK